MPRYLIFCLAVMLAVLPVSAASSATKVAVFPFDLRDVEQEGEIVPQLKEEDLGRVKLVAEELRVLLQKDDRYELVDMAPFASEIEMAAPLNNCDGCEVTIAQKAGADIAVTGFVDKWSDALISIQLFVRDVASGKVTKAMSAEVRGNTDELWLHGIRWLWRNRFNAEEKKN
ncbi:MAG: DUF3280 domain-containing protein [Hyphomicrobium sp.]|jgi:hypothetical protein|nr:DUF3280 domain-containing protein [Hyphomicrobium sp.]